MGKKKTAIKLRAFYRGNVPNPTLIANKDQMQTITDALKECLPKRSVYAYQTAWFNTGKVALKFVVGLKATLRCLKTKRAKAIIFDDTVGKHLEKYLLDFARKRKIPIVQAHRLIDLAPLIKLNTLSSICLIDPTKIDEKLYKEGDPKPKPIEDIVTSCQLFEKFSQLLQGIQVNENTSTSVVKLAHSSETKFELPILERIPSTGKSQEKKGARKVRESIRKNKNKPELNSHCARG